MTEKNQCGDEKNEFLFHPAVCIVVLWKRACGDFDKENHASVLWRATPQAGPAACTLD